MKIFFLILALVAFSQAQVLGIDFGTEFWKASLISPGKNLVIVENSRSGRKSINGIAIQEGVRYFEDDALYKRLKKPMTSYFYLGKLLRSLDFESPLEEYHFQNGTYFITHENEQISLEQLVGMILKNIKSHASHQAGSKIKDAVLAIPPSWGWRSKMALINAAQIADLQILGLVNQNSAAAINFAITRNDTDPINIGFFNLGSHNLQFSIIQFFGYHNESTGKYVESLRVLSHIVVEGVGGLQVDKAIADYLSEKFYQQFNLDPRKNKKSYIKLLHQASEAKQTLSANRETTVYVEGIMEGIDLNLHLSRELIQKLDIFQNLHKYLDQGLEKAGISKSELQSVEMIGGASRIPLVSKIVKQYFPGIEVGSHINADEAVAFGSSLRAANLSITFRVKQLHFYDGFEKDIKCVITSKGEVIEQKILFTKDSQHGDKTTMNLSANLDNITFDLFYGDELVKTYESSNISEWKNIYNETYNFSSNPNLVLGFVLTTTNIVDLKENYINLTFLKKENKTLVEWVEEEQSTNSSEPEKNQSEATLQTENASQTQQSGTQNTTQTESLLKNASVTEDFSRNQNVSQQNSNEEPQQDNKKSEDASQDLEKELTNSTSEQNLNNTKTSKRKRKIPLKKLVKKTREVEEQWVQSKKYQISTVQTFNKYPRYNSSLIEENQKILLKFQKHQKYLKQKSKIRNDLESTLYRLKDNYEDIFLIKFSKEFQLQNLKKVVSEKLLWLDQNAWTAEKEGFQKQYEQLFDAYSPIMNRSVEYRERYISILSNREQKYNQTLQSLSFTYHKTLDLNKTHVWLEDKIIDQLNKINTTLEKIHEKLLKQSKQQLNENPLIYNNQMLESAEKLRGEYYLLKMTPRPKVAKTPKPTKIHDSATTEEQKQENHKQSEQAQQGEPESSQNAKQSANDIHQQDQQKNSQDQPQKQQQEQGQKVLQEGQENQGEVSQDL